MTNLKDSLFKGIPVRSDIIIPWETPLGELLTLGDAKHEVWKRWEQDRDGRYFEAKKYRVVWNGIELPGISSIKALHVEFKKPEILFKEAEIYFSDRELLEKELTVQFSEPYVHVIEFMDKHGPEETIQKHWILVSSDSKLKISFILDGMLKIVFMRENSISPGISSLI